MCRAQAWGVVCDATSRPRQQLYGREGGGSVGFGLLQLGRDQASEPPSPAPYQPFGLLQLLSCLCGLAPPSGFHFSDCASTHWVRWTLKAIPSDLKGLFTGAHQPKSPSSWEPTAIVWIRNFSLNQQSHNQTSCHYCGCLSSSMFLTKITILEWSNVTFSSWDAVSRFSTRPSPSLHFWQEINSEVSFAGQLGPAEVADILSGKLAGGGEREEIRNQDEVAFRFHWPLNLQWHIQGIELKWKTLWI